MTFSDNNIRNEKLKEIAFMFKKMLDNELKNDELNFIITFCVKTATGYLRSINKRAYNLILYSNISVNDAVIDSIADLFTRNKENEFEIAVSYKNWLPPIQSNEEAIFFVNKIVTKKVEQYLTGLLKQTNPHFTKALNYFNYLIKVNDFEKLTLFGTTYITESKEIDLSKRILTAEDLDILPVELFNEGKNSIKNFLNFIKENGEFCVAIPYNAFICKHLQINTFNAYLEKNFIENGYDFDIKDIINNSLSKINDKIELSYYNKGKLTLKEVITIKSSLESFANDMIHGNSGFELFEYIARYEPDLTFLDYKIKYQNIFEYLIKLLKIELSQHILK